MLASRSWGDRDARRVVLLHGWPLRSEIWSEVAPAVGTRGFRVLVPDLPGFGESPPLKRDEATVESYAGAVAAFLRSFGSEPVALAGHSFGGYVALALADLHPDLVAGLALVSSRTIADSDAARQGRFETIKKVRHRGTEALLPGLADKLLGPRAGPSLRDRAERTIRGAAPEAVMAGLAAMAARPDRGRVLHEFPGSVLVVHGSADALIPVKEVAQPARTRGSFALQVLPEVGHMPMWEAPAELADALARWAAETLRSLV